VTDLLESIQQALDIANSHAGSRELSLVKTKLEEAQLWASKVPRPSTSSEVPR
jgi:hypothetical protein